MDNKDEMELLFTIVERGKGEDIADFLRENQVFMNIIVLAKGTAPTEWADFLGIGDSKKDIVITVISSEREDELLNSLNKEFHLSQAGKGIAFTIDVNSISSRKLIKYCKGMFEKTVSEQAKV